MYVLLLDYIHSFSLTCLPPSLQPLPLQPLHYHLDAPRFDPEKTVFKDVSKINPHLLQDIVNSYKKSQTVCKFCFFRNRRQEKLGANCYCKQCKRVNPTVIVMPSSKLCKNFANMKVVPVSKPPKVLMSGSNRQKPFQYCQRTNHVPCLEKSATDDVWFAHSIEELVVWTVERHCREWHVCADRPFTIMI